MKIDIAKGGITEPIGSGNISDYVKIELYSGGFNSIAINGALCSFIKVDNKELFPRRYESDC